MRSWKIYGSKFFHVKIEKSNVQSYLRHINQNGEVVLAINAKAAIIIDPESNEFIAEYLYNEVSTWGHNSTSFVLVMSLSRRISLECEEKLSFLTSQGSEIAALVDAYVKKMIHIKAKRQKDQHIAE